MVYVTHRKSLPRIERQEAGWYRGYDVSSLFGEEAFFMFKSTVPRQQAAGTGTAVINEAYGLHLYKEKEKKNERKITKHQRGSDPSD